MLSQCQLNRLVCANLIFEQEDALFKLKYLYPRHHVQNYDSNLVVVVMAWC